MNENKNAHIPKRHTFTHAHTSIAWTSEQARRRTVDSVYVCVCQSVSVVVAVRRARFKCDTLEDATRTYYDGIIQHDRCPFVTNVVSMPCDATTTPTKTETRLSYGSAMSPVILLSSSSALIFCFDFAMPSFVRPKQPNVWTCACLVFGIRISFTCVFIFSRFSTHFNNECNLQPMPI